MKSRQQSSYGSIIRVHSIVKDLRTYIILVESVYKNKVYYMQKYL